MCTTKIFRFFHDPPFSVTCQMPQLSPLHSALSHSRTSSTHMVLKARTSPELCQAVVAKLTQTIVNIYRFFEMCIER